MSKRATDISEHDTFYVLVTGANSGLGYSICERIISEFLFTRPSNQHLHLIPSTRSRSKSDDTIARLQSHIEDLSSGRVSKPVYFRSGPPAGHQTPSAEARALFQSRVILDSVQVDLCTLSTVFAAAQTLAGKVPRLDVLICNAGIGGWDGLDYVGAVRQMLNEGIVAMVSRPNWKICRVGAECRRQVATGDDVGRVESESEKKEPVLGEVFCANVFGHYIFVHEAMALLSRSGGSGGDGQRGRVVWIGTGEVTSRHFDINDLQGLKSLEAYEHTKRLIDLLILGGNGPAQAEAHKYLAIDSTAHEQQAEKDLEQSLYIVSEQDLSASQASSSRRASSQKSGVDAVPPAMYIAHPGVCLTAIAPLSIFMTWMQIATIYIARWLGSRWHTNTPYKGATSAAWLALTPDEELAREDAERKKWGSMVTRWGEESVVETPVDGWGLGGESKTEAYGDDARMVWKDMEALRKMWTKKVKSE